MPLSIFGGGFYFYLPPLTKVWEDHLTFFWTSVQAISYAKPLFVEQRRQHVLSDVALELFHGSEVLPAESTTRHDDAVLLVHEG
jgi:hypothetical protein